MRIRLGRDAVGMTDLSSSDAAPSRGTPSVEPAADLMGRLAHELKTPLTVAKGFAYTLRTSVEHLDPATIRRCADAILRGLSSAEVLVDSLSQTHSVDAGDVTLNLKSVEVAQFVAEVVRDLEIITQPHRVSVVVATEATAWFDPGKIRQVLTNLLSNAAKFSPADEPVVVEVSSDDFQVQISVIDRGCGISADDMHRLFTKYERLGSSVKGTGLGLYISRGIAVAHGGDITVESDGKSGCTFTLHLPIHAAEHIA